MKEFEPTLSGCLLAVSSASEPARTEWRFGQKVTVSQMESKSETKHSKFWKTLRWKSAQPLLGEPTGLSSYPYECYLLASPTNHFALVSSNSEITKAFCLQFNLVDGLRPWVDISAIVDLLSRGLDIYTLSNVWARTDGYGVNLKTVAFFGQDIAQAKIFNDFRREMDPFRIEIKDAASRTSVISINKNGEISFANGEAERGAASQALTFLNSHKFISWPDL